MAKEDLIEFEGVVTEVLPDGNYRVKLDNDHVILAYAAGKMIISNRSWIVAHYACRWQPVFTCRTTDQG